MVSGNVMMNNPLPYPVGFSNPNSHSRTGLNSHSHSQSLSHNHVSLNSAQVHSLAAAVVNPNPVSGQLKFPLKVSATTTDTGNILPAYQEAVNLLNLKHGSDSPTSKNRSSNVDFGSLGAGNQITSLASLPGLGSLDGNANALGNHFLSNINMQMLQQQLQLNAGFGGLGGLDLGSLSSPLQQAQVRLQAQTQVQLETQLKAHLQAQLNAQSGLKSHDKHEPVIHQAETIARLNNNNTNTKSKQLKRKIEGLVQTTKKPRNQLANSKTRDLEELMKKLKNQAHQLEKEIELEKRKEQKEQQLMKKAAENYYKEQLKRIQQKTSEAERKLDGNKKDQDSDEDGVKKSSIIRRKYKRKYTYKCREISSYKVFCKFVKYDAKTGVCDASGILSTACYEVWVDSRKRPPKKPEEAFRRALTAHCRGVDGRRAFPEHVEENLLLELRKKKSWACFQKCGDRCNIGIQGFPAMGYHEKRKQEMKMK